MRLAKFWEIICNIPCNYTVTADIKSYDGYPYNAGVSVISGEVIMPTANDKGGADMLTLKVYYDLEKKDQPVDPGKPNQPTDNGGTTDPANGSSATNTNAAAGTKTNNAVSPKTADSSMLYVSIVLFAVAVSGLVVLVLKRKGNAR